jgi:hypothetical protein
LRPVIVVAVVVVTAATATVLSVVHVQLRHPVDKLISYANPFWPTALVCASCPRSVRGVALYRLRRTRWSRTSIVSGKQTNRTSIDAVRIAKGTPIRSVSRPYRALRRKPSEFLWVYQARVSESARSRPARS